MNVSLLLVFSKKKTHFQFHHELKGCLQYYVNYFNVMHMLFEAAENKGI